MRDQREGDFAAVSIVAVLFLLLLLGGGAFVWQSRRAATLREAAELARTRAEYQQLLAVSQANLDQAAALEAELAQASPTVASAEANPQDDAVDQNADEIDAIKQLLFTQQKAWNNGDIDGFMEGYWKSEDLTFSSGGETTRSWQSTLDRYKNKYNTREAMGTLEFSELEVRLLSPQSAYVLGRWNLKDLAGGNFTLVMRKLKSGWVVVHDHTSKLENDADAAQ